jgi:hypothetical protein
MPLSDLGESSFFAENCLKFNLIDLCVNERLD